MTLRDLVEDGWTVTCWRSDPVEVPLAPAAITSGELHESLKARIMCKADRGDQTVQAGGAFWTEAVDAICRAAERAA